MSLLRQHRRHYTVVGALLGLGAPGGAFLLRLFLRGNLTYTEQFMHEWDHGFYYLYMTIATVIAFALFGYFLGKKGDLLERDKKRAATLATHDGLTELYNHRYLQEQLAAELERAKRYRTPLTCLMLDIDNFKGVNDTYGHPFGDHVLKVVARIIRDQVRRVDTAARYGGEEFFILMPHTTSQEILPVAERIRTEVQNYPFDAKVEKIRVTLSIGVATYNPDITVLAGKADLIKAADQALYVAKKRGKNQTHIWSAAGIATTAVL